MLWSWHAVGVMIVSMTSSPANVLNLVVPLPNRLLKDRRRIDEYYTEGFRRYAEYRRAQASKTEPEASCSSTATADTQGQEAAQSSSSAPAQESPKSSTSTKTAWYEKPVVKEDANGFGESLRSAEAAKTEAAESEAQPTKLSLGENLAKLMGLTASTAIKCWMRNTASPGPADIFEAVSGVFEAVSGGLSLPQQQPEQQESDGDVFEKLGQLLGCKPTMFDIIHAVEQLRTKYTDDTFINMFCTYVDMWNSLSEESKQEVSPVLEKTCYMMKLLKPSYGTVADYFNQATHPKCHKFAETICNRMANTTGPLLPIVMEEFSRLRDACVQESVSAAPEELEKELAVGIESMACTNDNTSSCCSQPIGDSPTSYKTCPSSSDGKHYLNVDMTTEDFLREGVEQ